MMKRKLIAFLATVLFVLAAPLVAQAEQFNGTIGEKSYTLQTNYDESSTQGGFTGAWAYLPTTGFQVRVNESGEWTDAACYVQIQPGDILYVRAADEEDSSKWATHQLPSRPAAPDLEVSGPATGDPNYPRALITGFAEGRSYQRRARGSGPDAWRVINSSLITDDGYICEPGTYEFRTVATPTSFASEIKTLTIAEPEPSVYVNGLDLALQPGCTMSLGGGTATYDSATKTLTLENATITESYSTNGAGIYSQVPLTIVLVGDNSISRISGVGINAQSKLTLTGTGTLDIRTGSTGINSSGALTVSGAKLTITTDESGSQSIYQKGGDLSVEQGATVTVVSSSPDCGIYNDGGSVTVADSTLSVQMNNPISYGCVNVITGDVTISRSKVTLTTTGTEANTVYAETGTISINNHTIMTARTEGYPALWGLTSVDMDNSTVDAFSGLSNAIYSPCTVRASDSVVLTASGIEGLDGIYADDGITFSNSWVTSTAQLTTLTSSPNSAVIEGSVGTVTGDLTLPASVTLDEGVTLTVPQDASITVPEGVTFTNSGRIVLEGTFTVAGGTGVCTESNHVGGVATCTQLARCAVCGTEYGTSDPTTHRHLMVVGSKEPTCTETGVAAHWRCEDCGALFADESGTEPATEESLVLPALGHDLEHVPEVAETCTEPGTAEHWTCTRCGALFSDEAGTKTVSADELVLPALGHRFENGVCAVCGAKDPDYVEPKDPVRAEAKTEENDVIPATGDPTSPAAAASALAGGALLVAGALSRRCSR